MKALLRPLVVGGLSIAIAGVGVWGGHAALAATNGAPTAVTIAASQTVVVEGDTISLTVQLDSAATEQLGVQVNWGDASPTVAFINPGQTQVEPPFEHVYTDDGLTATPQDQMTITVMVENATTSLSASTPVLVKNAPPTMTSLTVSPTTITPGQEATLNGFFEDAGKADRHNVTVTWGDGAAETFPRLLSKTYDFSYTHTYTVGGNHTVTARVTDDDTGWVEASAQLTVLSTNEPPSDLAVAMSAVDEGGTSTLTGTFDDPDAADTHDVTVNWGDGTPTETLPTVAAGVTEFTAAHGYADNGSYTVTVALRDSAEHSITGTTSVSVSNVAPAVNLAAVSSPVAGDGVALSGTFSDPGTADTFTLSVDWGDATAPGTPVVGADGRSFSASHAYAIAGPYVATVTVTDKDGGHGSASATIAVRPRNVPPTNLTLSAPAVAQGATTTVTGAFADTDASDTHSVVMSWGDGTAPVTTHLAAGVTTFTVTHTYAKAGAYTLSATVTDSAGASTSATTQSVVTAPSTAAELLDELSVLIQGYDLDRITERWLLHRVRELKNSLADGNEEVCDMLRGFDRFSSLVRRVLTREQMMALTELVTKLKASVDCSTTREEQAHHGPAVVTEPRHGDQDKNDRDRSDRGGFRRGGRE